jgi:hypothetical protein
VNKWVKENPGCAVCVGFPLAIAVASLHPVIAGAMLLAFLWVQAVTTAHGMDSGAPRSSRPLGSRAKKYAPAVCNSEEMLTATGIPAYDSWHERHTFP